ncbi:GIY-YIG catalytic domain-containing endonuclease [Paramecium bursaria Chlorella virus CvsA1]|nr:GIY-YIG catalytic domain-containing endonuclease [Paramecium bursaria Chlorella virus CviKI]AGE52460.1 GIY-YIG catalytic domain-containing endonuclease [Paramecium bursaria Chlorella virus CvsA1]AGE55228.1 GIY-YIG catalytic domain-containing endonuclease [Paramecium bursaria Chlorella virus MA1E]
MGYIYILTHKQKRYIGQTSQNIYMRFKQHQRRASGCTAIRNAIQYHGWDTFDKDYFEWVDDWDLDYIEMILIEELQTLTPNGYNLKEGGGSHGKMSEDSRRKMSIANKGEKHPNFGKSLSEITKQAISLSLSGKNNPNYGKSMSNAQKKAISMANMGKVKSEEHKQAIGKSRSGQLMGDTNPKSKQVYQYDIDGNYINYFGSVNEAARSLGIKRGSNISCCARGLTSLAYGFKWSYVRIDE